MKLNSVLISLLLLNVILGNGGIRLRINKTKLKLILKIFLQTINAKIAHLEFGESKDLGYVRISDVAINVQPLISRNIKFLEVEGTNYLMVGITGIQMDTSCRVLRESFPSCDLNPEILIHINLIKVKIEFQKFSGENPNKPYVQMTLVDLVFNQETVQIKLGSESMIGVVYDKVVSFLKTYILGKGKSILESAFPTTITSIANGMVEHYYPLTFDIPNLETDISTKLVKELEITQGEIIFNVDGKFDTKWIQSEIIDESKRVVEVSMSPGSTVEVDLTQYTIESFINFIARYSEILNKASFKRASKSKSQDQDAYSRSSLDFKKETLQIDEKGIHIKDFDLGYTTHSTSGFSGFSLRMPVSADLWLEMHKMGQKRKNVYQATLQIHDFAITEFGVGSFHISGVDEDGKATQGLTSNLHLDIKSVNSQENGFELTMPPLSLPPTMSIKNIDMKYQANVVSVAFQLDDPDARIRNMI